MVNSTTPEGDLAEQKVEMLNRVLQEMDLTFTHTPGEGNECARFIVKLPGEKKFTTPTMISIFPEQVRFEAFICRNPDENFVGVYKYLLKRNRRLYIIRYVLDEHGDIYLVGTLGLSIFHAAEVDNILGQLAQTADEDFNILLELGFANSIRKEWEWRTSTGQSVKNLRAFAHLIEQKDIPPSSHQTQLTDAGDEKNQITEIDIENKTTKE